MATTNVVNTYGDESRKEDVLSLVEILTARENSFLTTLGKVRATDTIHQTMTDTLRTTATAAVAEEGDFTNLARSTPSRLTNLVEIVAIPFRVSRTQQQISKHTGQNELARQTTKALMEWGNAAEYDLLKSTLASGVSGTTPKMSGIIEAVSLAKNTSAQSSGTVFSATILKAMMRQQWAQSNGTMVTDLYTNEYVRETIDTFTTKTNQLVMAPGVREISDAVSTYTSSFGTLKLHTHRDIVESTDATAYVLMVRPEMLKIAYLQTPEIQDDLSRSGDYDNRVVIGKMTLEVRNQETHCWHSGFKKD